MAGDQQAALFGQACWSPGQAKNTYGTGCFLLMNMGDKSPVSSHGLLTTICCDAQGKPAYALEGSVFVAGAAVQWLRDELQIIQDAAETDELARELDDNEGVYLVPAFAGLGAPYWDMDARGVIVGLTRGSGRRHLARAALEAIAYQSRDIVESMNKDSGIALKELRVDGGAANNNFLMQFQADILDVPVDRPKLVETTAAGSAYLAGLAVGVWNSPKELEAAIEHDRRFEPAMNSSERARLYQGWTNAIARTHSKPEVAEIIITAPVQKPAVGKQSVRHHTRMIKTADGIELFSQCWVPDSPAGVIVLVHGLAEHSGRYADTARYLAGTGWAVYACDLRGHGLSPDGHRVGRVHVDDFTDYFQDVKAMLTEVTERHPDIPRVIFGHSMGGLIAIRYAVANPHGLKGAIISSPALGTHPDFKPPAMLKLLVKVLSKLAPRALFKSELDTNVISHDPEVVNAYVSDPLVSEKVSARWYASMMQAMNDAHAEAPKLKIPMLLMQSGDDRLVDPAAPGRWAQAAPNNLVELQVWDGFYHEMLNEPDKDRVRERITRWLETL
jgi:alpha-beta hydrolase superfamily lysophospholipase